MFRRVAILIALGVLVTAIAVPTMAGSSSTRVSGDITMTTTREGKQLTEGDHTWQINTVQDSGVFDLDAAGGTLWDDVTLTAHVHVKLNNTTFSGHYWGYTDIFVSSPAITCQGSFTGKVDFLGVTEGPLRATCSDGSQLKATLTTFNIGDDVVNWTIVGRVTP